MAFLLLNPTTTSASALETEEPLDDTGYDDQISTQADNGVTISFTPQSGSASLTPTTSDGASAKINVSANIKIASTGGYTIYLGGKNSALTGEKTGKTISAMSGSKTFANLDTNTWGYAYAEGSSVSDTATYSALPQGQGKDLASASGNSTNVNRTFAISFATKIGNDKPADTYSNQVTLSVTSSPLQLALNDISNMQDMTSEVCASTATGVSAQLKDTRDNKYYWVTKLADGKCWMTQNLALDLSSNPVKGDAAVNVAKTFTDADTDLNSKTSWTPTSKTYDTVDSTTILADNTGQRSWNLGSYYIKTPNDTTSCGSQKNSLANCTSYFTALAAPTSANGDLNAHYLTSHYYQWGAATAGSGGTITSGQAQDSICPRGWRLPTSNTDGEFQTLMNKYNITSGTATSGDTTNLVSAPLYFVRGGYVNQNTSILFNAAGYEGSYWSSTPHSTGGTAYNLYFSGTTNIDPSNNYYRYLGRSVRCIAR